MLFSPVSLQGRALCGWPHLWGCAQVKKAEGLADFPHSARAQWWVPGKWSKITVDSICDTTHRCGRVSRSCSPDCRGILSHFKPSRSHIHLRLLNSHKYLVAPKLKTLTKLVGKLSQSNLLESSMVKHVSLGQVRPGVVGAVPQHGQQRHSAAQCGGNQRKYPGAIKDNKETISKRIWSRRRSTVWRWAMEQLGAFSGLVREQLSLLLKSPGLHWN